MKVYFLTTCIFIIQILLKAVLNNEVSYVSLLLTQACVVIIPTFGYLISNKKNIKRYFGSISSSKDIVIAILSVISLHILSQFINFPFIRLFINDTREVASIVNSPYEIIINVILICVIPAFFEEILFRGIFLDELISRYTRFTSCLIVSVIFSTIHLDAGNVIPQFILSMFLCELTLFSKSIIIPIITHFVHNIFVILLQPHFAELISDNKWVFIAVCIAMSAIGVNYFKKDK